MANDRQQKITIDNLKVPADVTYFPFLITRDHLDDEVVDPSGSSAAQADGDDIRIYETANQTDELARELVNFEHDTTTGAGDADIEIWTSETGWLISASSDTDIYLEYGDAALSDYAVTDTFGRNAVWTNDAGVSHMNSTSPIDSTGANTLTGNALSSATGKWSNAVDFNGSSSDVDWGAMIQGSGNFYYTAWVNPDVLSGFQGIMGNWISSDQTTGYLGYNGSSYNWNNYQTAGLATTFGSPSTGVWEKVGVARDGTTNYCRVNGVDITNVTRTGDPPSTPRTWLGALTSGTNNFFNGKIADIKLTDSFHTANWDLTEFNNQNSPSTFASPGTPVAIGEIPPQMMLTGVG